MTVSRIAMAPDGPECSRFVAGLWRLADWNLSVSQRVQLLEQYLQLGVTTMDHADIYGGYQCEGLFGEALAQAPQLREQMQIVTKCGIKLIDPARPAHRVKHYDTDAAHILQSADHSLQQLRCDYLDVLLLHRPDPLLQADEVAEAFERLRSSGKVRYFGVSNFSAGQFELLQSRLDYPLVTNQVEISPLVLDGITDGTLDHCQQRRISPMAWSCLGGGRLFSDDSEPATKLRRVLTDVARECNVESIEAVVYAWVLQLPSRPLPLIGSGKIERVEQALAAEAITLSRQQWFRIYEVALGSAVP